MKVSKSEQEQARVRLLEILKPGDTVYTVLRHVSRSGMQRRIDCFKIDPEGYDGKPRMQYLSGWIATATGMRRDYKSGSLVVGGCGMDMGFHIVYNLSMSLFCPKKYDHDGAYALKHEWI